MKTIFLGNSNLVAIIDDEDFGKVFHYNWSVYTDNHVHTGLSTGENLSLHRFVLGLSKGDLPGYAVHHKNENPLDNQKENLEIVSKSKHRQKDGVRSDSPSGYKGVCLERRGRKNPWVARLTHSGKRYSFGSYKTPIEAAIAYDKGAIKVFGIGCYLNFPEPANSK